MPGGVERWVASVKSITMIACRCACLLRTKIIRPPMITSAAHAAPTIIQLVLSPSLTVIVRRSSSQLEPDPFSFHALLAVTTRS